jgi:hypothetical protein
MESASIRIHDKTNKYTNIDKNTTVIIHMEIA